MIETDHGENDLYEHDHLCHNYFEYAGLYSPYSHDIVVSDVPAWTCESLAWELYVQVARNCLNVLVQTRRV